MSKSGVFEIFEEIEKTNSRNDMIVLLSQFFKSLDVFKIQIYAYLLQGRLAPLFVDREFNFSERLALKVLDSISKVGDSNIDVFKLRDELGDAGLVAKVLIEKRGLKDSEFNIKDLYESLWGIIDIEGMNSVSKKSNLFSELILKSSPTDAKFLTRIISGKLRIGCSSKTMLDAYSFCLAGDKSLRDDLDNIYGVVADLGYVASIVFSKLSLEEKRQSFRKVSPIPGIPIFPRLVERVSSFQNAIERFPEGCIIQPKFDGLRCQIHAGVKYSDIYEKSIWTKFLKKNKAFDLFEKTDDDCNIKLFSRNLNDITAMFPEIVDEIKNFKKSSFILDGEIVGWNPKKNKYISFQETMSRKRKYGIVEKIKSVPVKYFAFDLLSLDGKSFLNVDLQNRLKELSSFLPIQFNLVGISESICLVNKAKSLQKVFNKYVNDGLEGIVLKKFAGGYLPGVRNFDWVKIKKSVDKRVVDTIDAVVLGYYYGSGKKTDFGMGSLLVGIYNSKKDVFESVGKVGTGFSDNDWIRVAKRLKPLELKYRVENIHSKLKAHVWVEPEVVLTIEADEISKSTVHVAGKSKLGFGLSLRFPRLIEFDRDKLPQDCTSDDELIEMWKMALNK